MAEKQDPPTEKGRGLEQLEEENEKLRTRNIQLCNEENRLKHCQVEQVACLHATNDALDEVRGRLRNYRQDYVLLDYL